MMQGTKLFTILLIAVSGIGVLVLAAGSKGVSVFAAAAPAKAGAQQEQPTPEATKNPLLSALEGTTGTNAPETASAVETAISIVLHLILAVLLAAALAFRPRKNFPLFQRNLYVAQTQILLAAVAAALMMIVGDNTARAFAIFAAVSIVRFRTNIRDPKEVTVLLISLALGLASGVGRWDLGIALCGFSLVLLYVLEYKEQEQAFRSMELTVKTRNTEVTQNLLRKVFSKNKLDAEVRQLDPADDSNPIGRIQYYLNLRLSYSTDHLSDKIMAIDRNVEGIQWSKTKSATDIYQ